MTTARHALIFLAIGCTLAACGELCFLPAQSRDSLSRTAPFITSASALKALETISQRDCDTGWRIAWDAARHGDEQSLLLLAQAAQQGLRPPAPLQNYRHAVNRHNLAIIAAASLIEDKYRINFYKNKERLSRSAAKILAHLYGDQSEAARCFVESSIALECYANGTKMGHISSISAVSNEMERSTSTYTQAECPLYRFEPDLIVR